MWIECDVPGISLLFGWYQYRYLKKLVPEKVPVPVPKKILGSVTLWEILSPVFSSTRHHIYVANNSCQLVMMIKSFFRVA